MAEINSLYRTFSPKYTHYLPDGQGRDVYINDNNGGFLKKLPKGGDNPNENYTTHKYYQFQNLK